MGAGGVDAAGISKGSSSLTMTGIMSLELSKLSGADVVNISNRIPGVVEMFRGVTDVGASVMFGGRALLLVLVVLIDTVLFALGTVVVFVLGESVTLTGGAGDVGGSVIGGYSVVVKDDDVISIPAGHLLQTGQVLLKHGLIHLQKGAS